VVTAVTVVVAVLALAWSVFVYFRPKKLTEQPQLPEPSLSQCLSPEALHDSVIFLDLYSEEPQRRHS